MTIPVNNRYFYTMRTLFGFLAEPALNSIQIEAIEIFRDKKDSEGNSLDSRSFRGKEWFNSRRHLHELDQLVTMRRYSFTEALRIIEDENKLYLGLNSIQVKALQEFEGFGLTREQLLARAWFDHEAYYEAMNVLLSLEGLKIAQMWERLEGLKAYQVIAIAAGYEKAEIIDLNEFQVKALMAFKKHGLSAEVLRANLWLNEATQLTHLSLLLAGGLSLSDCLSYLRGDYRESLLDIMHVAGGAGAGAIRLVAAHPSCETTDPVEIIEPGSISSRMGYCR